MATAKNSTPKDTASKGTSANVDKKQKETGSKTAKTHGSTSKK
jgi:hypothetical protein